MLRAAVLGSPIVHSLSPHLHRAAHQGMGLHDWHYEAIECDEAGLPGLLAGLDGDWAGLSLTMPLKRAVMPLLDTVSELAVQVGGVNTVILRDGARHGHNTDVYGIVQALEILGATATKPLVVRLDGNKVEEGRAILRAANNPLVTLADTMDEGADKAAELAAR